MWIIKGYNAFGRIVWTFERIYCTRAYNINLKIYCTRSYSIIYCTRMYNMIFERNTALGCTVWCIALGHTIQFLKRILHSVVQYDVLHSVVQYDFWKQYLIMIYNHNSNAINAKMQFNADCFWWFLAPWADW